MNLKCKITPAGISSLPCSQGTRFWASAFDEKRFMFWFNIFRCLGYVFRCLGYIFRCLGYLHSQHSHFSKGESPHPSSSLGSERANLEKFSTLSRHLEYKYTRHLEVFAWPDKWYNFTNSLMLRNDIFSPDRFQLGCFSQFCETCSSEGDSVS